MCSGPLCVQGPLAPSELCVQGPLHLLGASLHEGALCRDPPLQGSLCLQFAVPATGKICKKGLTNATDHESSELSNTMAC